MASFSAGCTPPQAPQPQATLAVTWIVPGRPPQTTQRPMRDMQSCKEAQASLTPAPKSPVDETKAAEMQEAAVARARKIGATLSTPGPDGMTSMGTPVPRMSALCIDLKARTHRGR